MNREIWETVGAKVELKRSTSPEGETVFAVFPFDPESQPEADKLNALASQLRNVGVPEHSLMLVMCKVLTKSKRYRWCDTL